MARRTANALDFVIMRRLRHVLIVLALIVSTHLCTGQAGQRYSSVMIDGKRQLHIVMATRAVKSFLQGREGSLDTAKYPSHQTTFLWGGWWSIRIPAWLITRERPLQGSWFCSETGGFFAGSWQTRCFGIGNFWMEGERWRTRSAQRMAEPPNVFCAMLSRERCWRNGRSIQRPHRRIGRGRSTSNHAQGLHILSRCLKPPVATIISEKSSRL